MMTADEVKKVIDQLKEEGTSDDDLLYGFYMMFCDDKVNIDQLEEMCSMIGYELTEEFKNMSIEDQKTKGYVED